MGSLFAALNAADGKLGAPCESKPEMDASFRLVNRRAKRSDSAYPPEPHDHQKSSAVPIPRSNSVLDEERARIASTLKMTPLSSELGPNGLQPVEPASDGNVYPDTWHLQTEPQPIPDLPPPGPPDPAPNHSPDTETPRDVRYPQINTSIWRTTDPFADAAAKPCYRHLSQEMEALQHITGRTLSLTELLELNEATGIRCAPRREVSGSMTSDEPWVSYSTVEEWVDGVESAMMGSDNRESEDEGVGGVLVVEAGVRFRRRRAGAAAKFFLVGDEDEECEDDGYESGESDGCWD